MTGIVLTCRPFGSVAAETLDTVPAIGVCTGAEMNASALPIISPAETSSFVFTVASHGAPVCWSSGTATRAGAGMTSMALSSDRPLPSGG